VNRGRKPKHAISEEVKDHIAELYRKKYHGSNNCHFTELLRNTNRSGCFAIVLGETESSRQYMPSPVQSHPSLRLVHSNYIRRTSSVRQYPHQATLLPIGLTSVVSHVRLKSLPQMLAVKPQE
jgi:hypothetical protein